MQYLKKFNEFINHVPTCNVQPPKVEPHPAEIDQQRRDHAKAEQEKKEQERKEQEELEHLASSTTVTRNTPNS